MRYEELPRTPPPLPDWLLGNKESDFKKRYLQIQADREQYEYVFDSILDRVCEGVSIKSALKEDRRVFDSADFIKWIHKDPTRKERLREAQKVGAEMIASDMIDISDGKDNVMEDVHRSTLRVNTRKFLIGVFDRARFGEVKQIEHTGSISIIKALEEADARVKTVMDVEYRDMDQYELPNGELE